jgi:putative ABC transport system permease protein
VPRCAKKFLVPRPSLGQLVRIGDRRFRIVGVLAASGQGLGMNTDELVFVPVSLAQAMFNSNTCFAFWWKPMAASRLKPPRYRWQRSSSCATRANRTSPSSHRMQCWPPLTVCWVPLTLGVAGIAAISLAVAGILVMNVMLVSVSQRTAEIGLLKALGATGGTIRNVFLTEATMLSLAGAVVGYLLGQLGAAIIRQLYPTFPAYPPEWAVMAGLATALVTGILFGVLPARRAAQLDPVQALSKR